MCWTFLCHRTGYHFPRVLAIICANMKVIHQTEHRPMQKICLDTLARWLALQFLVQTLRHHYHLKVEEKKPYSFEPAKNIKYKCSTSGGRKKCRDGSKCWQIFYLSRHTRRNTMADFQTTRFFCSKVAVPLHVSYKLQERKQSHLDTDQNRKLPKTESLLSLVNP